MHVQYIIRLGRYICLFFTEKQRKSKPNVRFKRAAWRRRLRALASLVERPLRIPIAEEKPAGPKWSRWCPQT